MLRGMLPRPCWWGLGIGLVAIALLTLMIWLEGDDEQPVHWLVLGATAVVMLGIIGFEWPIFESKSPGVVAFFRVGPAVLTVLAPAILFLSSTQTNPLAPPPVSFNEATRHLPPETQKSMQEGLQRMFYPETVGKEPKGKETAGKPRPPKPRVEPEKSVP